MHYSYLFLLAVAAYAAPGHVNIQEREELLPGDVQLSDLPAHIEPWPGYFSGEGPQVTRSLEKRSPVSAGVCRNHPGSPQGQGWLLKQAVCERQDGNGASFWSDCVGRADRSVSANSIRGSCSKGYRCTEFHGQNELLETSFDITCVDTRSVREWFIDATASHDYIKCSPKYINQIPGNTAVNLTLQVNILDRDKLNRIGVDNIYFWMNDEVRVGVQRGHDADVNSGLMTLYHGHWVRACVKISPGQTVWAYAHMLAVTVVYCALGHCTGPGILPP